LAFFATTIVFYTVTAAKEKLTEEEPTTKANTDHHNGDFK